MAKVPAADRIPGNWRAVSYGRTGLILLGIAAVAAGFALLAEWLAPDSPLGRGAASLALVWAIVAAAAAVCFLLVSALGPRLFPNSRPRRVWFITLLVGYLVFVFGVVSWVPGPCPPTSPRKQCCINLNMVGDGLILARESGRLRPLAGPAFLLQVAEQFGDEDLRYFVCPEDKERPREVRRDALHCSYRGPDLETARRFVEGTLPEDTIIACDACGPRGDVPHHEDALVILHASGRVKVLHRGQPGGPPATVGPDSPDPRFRHLIR